MILWLVYTRCAQLRVHATQPYGRRLHHDNGRRLRPITELARRHSSGTVEGGGFAFASSQDCPTLIG